MRYTFIIGLLIYFSNCCAQIDNMEHKFGQFRYYQDDTIQTRLKDIVKTDSSKNSCYLIFKSYAKLDLLVAELKYYQCQNNTKNGYLTRNIYIYSQNGKVILYELFNMVGLEIERYQFDYNNVGQITKKEGFGS